MMIKLDNRGWGSKDVMMIISVMIVAVIVTMFIYNKNFKTLFEGDTEKDSLPTETYNYEKAETDLEVAAKEYYSDNFDKEKVGEIPLMTITSNTLTSKNYLKDFKANDHVCTGYVHIKNNDGKITYEPYVKCGDYKTKGYTASLND